MTGDTPEAAARSFQRALKMDEIVKWLTERADNCSRIAHSKVGQERRGWLEDEAYFRAAIRALAGSTKEGE